jgi:hypothetical protein
MNEYVISVRTDKNLGTEEFVRDFLGDWCRDLDPRLRPEFFDLGEPVRKSLAGAGFEQAVRLWLEKRPAVMLARRSKPRFLADIEWRRERGLDARPFPWGVTVYSALSAGDDLAELLLRFLIRHLDPAFGYITTRDEEREKHQISFQDRIGRVQQYKGLDVGETLPGVYWKTFFGKAVTPKLSSFDRLPAHDAEEVASGWLVTAYKTARASGTKEAREAEARIMDRLGRSRFFEKQTVNIESLKADDQTVATLEAAIRAKKARK